MDILQHAPVFGRHACPDGGVITCDGPATGALLSHPADCSCASVVVLAVESAAHQAVPAEQHDSENHPVDDQQGDHHCQRTTMPHRSPYRRAGPRCSWTQGRRCLSGELTPRMRGQSAANTPTDGARKVSNATTGAGLAVCASSVAQQAETRSTRDVGSPTCIGPQLVDGYLHPRRRREECVVRPTPSRPTVREQSCDSWRAAAAAFALRVDGSDGRGRQGRRSQDGPALTPAESVLTTRRDRPP